MKTIELTQGARFSVAGRIVALRSFGKAAALAREKYIADHPELCAASNLPKILGYRIVENAA
jgi:hypothetical protein